MAVNLSLVDTSSVFADEYEKRDPPGYSNVKSLLERIKSFSDCPFDCIKRASPPYAFAMAGFYLPWGISEKKYTDCVKCAFCFLILGDFSQKVIPFQEHVKANPNCEYIQEKIEVLLSDYVPTIANLCLELEIKYDSKFLLTEFITVEEKVDEKCSVSYIDFSKFNRYLNETEDGEHDDFLKCKICSNRKMCVAFMPCRHLLACQICADQCAKCPTCKKDIKGTSKFYIS